MINSRTLPELIGYSRTNQIVISYYNRRRQAHGCSHAIDTVMASFPRDFVRFIANIIYAQSLSTPLNFTRPPNSVYISFRYAKDRSARSLLLPIGKCGGTQFHPVIRKYLFPIHSIPRFLIFPIILVIILL